MERGLRKSQADLEAEAQAWLEAHADELGEEPTMPEEEEAAGDGLRVASHKRPTNVTR